ncbi:MAG: YbaB/EbfC family nucleoid-associated protein [Cyanobacteria bacterium NC_groundwater_1444_Ag_S-0.65um_54_12]|nr:YbaB/EbfC family nucleoid-associated protein [Cyanobacteria bacterium NC_groundwater_1444_Ag_S-0.65um_54_12]
MPGGMPGGLGGMDLGKMMKQAQKMQEDIAKAQASLADQTIEGTAGGGAVIVTVNGQREMVGIQIKPEAVDPAEIEMLEDLILAAVRDAQAKAAALAEQQLASITGQINLPGLL